MSDSPRDRLRKLREATADLRPPARRLCSDGPVLDMIAGLRRGAAEWGRNDDAYSRARQQAYVAVLALTEEALRD
jgi:hypothetical protein